MVEERPSNFKKLSVLMPIYNEARTLRTIVERVLSSPLKIAIELICVDDGSSDSSPRILRELAMADERIKIFHHEQNQGKGAAIQTAIKHLTGEIALVQDADLEYDPADYPLILAPILEGKADAAFGSRFASPPQRKVLLYWHTLGNSILTWITNMFNDINLTDMMTGYKAVRADILKQIPLKSKRFGIEPELTTRLAQWKVRIYEIPVSYHGRTYAEDKKIRLKDAFEALWCLCKFRFLSPRFTTNNAYYTLQCLHQAKGFNRWMLRQFTQFVGDRIFEAGCGIGSFTELLLDKQKLICADNDQFYVKMVSRRFGHLENVATLQMDLAVKAQYDGLKAEEIDTIVCLNVLEHIENDRDVLKNFFDLLKPGGHAIILVPFHPRLYTKCDEMLGHYRRYNEEGLKSNLEDAGFDLVSLKHFNRLGVLGWYTNGKMSRQHLSSRQIQIYNWLLPVAKLIDKIGLGPGLSLIGIGQKP